MHREGRAETRETRDSKVSITRDESKTEVFIMNQMGESQTVIPIQSRLLRTQRESEENSTEEARTEVDNDGARISHMALIPYPSSSEETIMPSGANSQGHHPPYPRSALLELLGDDVNGWRALAADIEGRHRLVYEIRQVLNAMRKGENLRAEVQF